jgi:hypothetical protein
MHAALDTSTISPLITTPVRLLVLLGLLAACGSPPTAAPPSATTKPTPTVAAATASPVASAAATPRDLADALAKAFASKDADAVGRLLTTQSSLGVSAVVEPVVQSDSLTGNCCVLIVSVASFVNELRAKFASGALTVSVDPQVQTTPVNTSASPFFVSSDWREADRTTKIDLYLRDMGSAWRWTGALQHYPRSAARGVCIVDYRPPWVPTGTTTHGC